MTTKRFFKSGRWLFAGLFGALTLVCATADCHAQVTVTVYAVDFDFTDTGIGGTHYDPVIDVGDTVRWQFAQGVHSTTSAAGQQESWNSLVQFTGFFEHTFTQLGTFEYFCSVHGLDNGNGTASGMSGQVTVVPEPSAYAAVFGVALAGFGIFRRLRSVAGSRG